MWILDLEGRFWQLCESIGGSRCTRVKCVAWNGFLNPSVVLPFAKHHRSTNPSSAVLFLSLSCQASRCAASTWWDEFSAATAKARRRSLPHPTGDSPAGLRRSFRFCFIPVSLLPKSPVLDCFGSDLTGILPSIANRSSPALLLLLRCVVPGSYSISGDRSSPCCVPERLQATCDQLLLPVVLPREGSHD